MNEPLRGIRLIDLSRIVVGPYCTMVLGDLGAEVIKIEQPGLGDDTRKWGPPFAGGESAYFFSLNRNKKSVTLNLKSQPGKEIFKRLVTLSDILVENYRVGTMEKMGLGYEVLKEINPRLIYCSVSGYGHTGPLRHKAGYDVIVSAEAGLMGITGEEDGGPVKVGVAITDITTGLFAQGAIATALYVRERTGRGQRIELSLFESQVATLINIASSYLIAGELPRRWGTAHASIVPYQAFKASDAYILVGVGTQRFWERFCKILKLDHLINDPRYCDGEQRIAHRRELIEILQERISQKAAGHWLRKLDEVGIPCGPINSLDQVFAHPQIAARSMIVEVNHPTAGRIKLVGIPVKYSETSGSIRLPPPLLGEHNEEILTGLLGISRQAFEGLTRKGVI
jgi:crotonobetainyl-CoA:carnitine CoA-transferase CaiB-like acyl-CoA transferase